MGNADLLDLDKLDDKEAGAFVRDTWARGRHVLVYAFGDRPSIVVSPRCEHSVEADLCVACGDEPAADPYPGVHVSFNLSTGYSDADALAAAINATAEVLRHHFDPVEQAVDVVAGFRHYVCDACRATFTAPADRTPPSCCHRECRHVG